jgi:hypothetical protein
MSAMINVRGQRAVLYSLRWPETLIIGRFGDLVHATASTVSRQSVR